MSLNMQHIKWENDLRKRNPDLNETEFKALAERKFSERQAPLLEALSQESTSKIQPLEECIKNEKITYEYFIQHRRAGIISAGIDSSTALKFINYLPKRYQYINIFWTWAWILSFPGFICVAIFLKWWIGLLLLCFVPSIISKSIKNSTAQFVLEYAEENKEFFEILTKNNSLIFTNK